MGPRCSGQGSFYTLAIVIYSSRVISGTGLTKCQVIRSLFRIGTEPIVNIIHGSHHQFPITTLLYSDVYICVLGASPHT